jgi:hypothetical protein
MLFLKPPESFCSLRAYFYQWHMRGGEPGLWPGLAPLCYDSLSARGKGVKAPDETTFSAGISGPESVLPGWLWHIPDDSPTSNLNAIADAHHGSGSVSNEFSPALSTD